MYVIIVILLSENVSANIKLSLKKSNVITILQTKKIVHILQNNFKINLCYLLPFV